MSEMKSLVNQQQQQLDQYREIIAALQSQLDGTAPMALPMALAGATASEPTENGRDGHDAPPQPGPRPTALYSMPQGADLSNIAANMMGVNQEMSTDRARLRTFFPDWPRADITPHALAASGLYYSPTAASLDRCICYCCHEVLFDWEVPLTITNIL